MKFLMIIAMTAALAGCSSANSMPTASLAAPTTDAKAKQSLDPLGAKYGDDCTPTNGQWGFYGNIWCDANKDGWQGGMRQAQQQK